MRRVRRLCPFWPIVEPRSFLSSLSRMQTCAAQLGQMAETRRKRKLCKSADILLEKNREITSNEPFALLWATTQLGKKTETCLKYIHFMWYHEFFKPMSAGFHNFHFRRLLALLCATGQLAQLHKTWQKSDKDREIDWSYFWGGAPQLNANCCWLLCATVRPNDTNGNDVNLLNFAEFCLKKIEKLHQVNSFFGQF